MRSGWSTTKSPCLAEENATDFFLVNPTFVFKASKLCIKNCSSKVQGHTLTKLALTKWPTLASEFGYTIKSLAWHKMDNMLVVR